MTQLAIFRLRGGDEFVCRLQTDFGVETPYILCAMVVPRAGWGALIPRLHLPFDLNGIPHLILMTEIISIPAGDLGPVVGDAGNERDAVIRAVDLLVTGF